MIYYLISGKVNKIESYLKANDYKFIPSVVNNPNGIVATPNNNYWFIDESNIKFLRKYVKQRFEAKLEYLTLKEFKRVIRKNAK